MRLRCVALLLHRFIPSCRCPDLDSHLGDDGPTWHRSFPTSPRTFSYATVLDNDDSATLSTMPELVWPATGLYLRRLGYIWMCAPDMLSTRLGHLLVDVLTGSSCRYVDVVAKLIERGMHSDTRTPVRFFSFRSCVALSWPKCSRSTISFGMDCDDDNRTTLTVGHQRCKNEKKCSTRN